jgi:hypothetical protein
MIEHRAAGSPAVEGSAMGLWAITCYFNPAGFRRRRDNYLEFRRHLSLPLVTVELAYGSRFELESEDTDVLLQVTGGDVMWQKERLLNLALSALPSSCTQVVWMDADVILNNDAWVDAVDAGLQRYALLRPFETSPYVGPEWTVADMNSADAQIQAKTLPMAHFDAEDAPASCQRVLLPAKPWGKAWAAKRELLSAHGLYDACVVGGGDVAIVFAACGQFEKACELLRLDGKRRQHYLDWAHGFHESTGGRVGYLEGIAYHLWHGAVADRRYGERHEEFRRFGFDPQRDIESDETGCWRWNGADPEMQDFVRRYFDSRREDG